MVAVHALTLQVILQVTVLVVLRNITSYCGYSVILRYIPSYSSYSVIFRCIFPVLVTVCPHLFLVLVRLVVGIYICVCV